MIRRPPGISLKDSEMSRVQLMVELKRLRKEHGRGRDEVRQGPDRLAALHAVKVALGAGGDHEAALQAALQVICQAEGWEAGLYWHEVVPHGALGLAAAWSDPGIAFEAIASLGRQTTFKQGFGPLGQTWTSADAEDVIDLGVELRSPRALYFQQEGLRWAAYHPVLAAGRIVGAFELVGIDAPGVEPGRRMLLDLAGCLVAARFGSAKLVEFLEDVTVL